MNREETIARLEEAKQLPHCTVEDIGTAADRYPREMLEEYLKDFLKPSTECWLCQKPRYIQWGLQHGIAHCENCGIDVKCYHYLKDNDGKERRLEFTLSPHPKHYSINE